MILSEDRLRHHMVSHNQNTVNNCNICQQLLSSNDKLKRHIETEHMGQNTKAKAAPGATHFEGGKTHSKRPVHNMHHLCYSYNVYFDTVEVLTIHIDKNHVTDMRKHCPHCSQRPNNNQDLEKHLVKDHNEEWRVPRRAHNRNHSDRSSRQHFTEDQKQYNYYKNGVAEVKIVFHF